MEQRKLQEVGGGTYTVSIPKEWAEARSLAAGSTVHLHAHVDGSLVVRTQQADGGELTETRLAVEGRDATAIRAELAGAHAAGFDAVSVEADGSLTEEQRHAVEEATRRLVGMEITDQDETAMTVRNLLDAGAFSVRQSVVQLQFVALSALREATTELVECGDAVERVRERAAEADRLRDAIARRFNRALSSFEELDRLALTRPELFDYYATAEELRGVADRSADVARVGTALPGSLPGAIVDEFRDLSATLLAVAEDTVTAVLADDCEGGHDALDRCETAATTIERLERRLSEGGTVADPTDAVALFRALDALDRVVDDLAAVAAVAIRSARRPEGE